MKIYAISDTHFGHVKLVDISKRPQNFSELILKNLRKVSGDILIHCGDFCIGNDEEHHANFMAATIDFRTKVLVRGNHDPRSDNWYYERGWDFVCYAYVADMFGTRILFTHMPLPHRDQAEHWSPHFPPTINIHGHMHGNNHRTKDFPPNTYDRKFHYDLAPEINKYAPVNVENIVSTLSVDKSL